MPAGGPISRNDPTVVTPQFLGPLAARPLSISRIHTSAVCTRQRASHPPAASQYGTFGGHDDPSCAASRSVRQRTNRRSVAAIVLMVYAARAPRREKVRHAIVGYRGFVDWSGVHVVSGTFRAGRRPLGKREHTG